MNKRKNGVCSHCLFPVPKGQVRCGPCKLIPKYKHTFRAKQGQKHKQHKWQNIGINVQSVNDIAPKMALFGQAKAVHISKASNLLGISKTAIRYHASKGRIKMFRVRGSPFINRVEIEKLYAFLESSNNI